MFISITWLQYYLFMDAHEKFYETYELFVEEISYRIQSIMQVNFMKELETSFWDFVHKLFEEITIWYLF